MTFKNAIEKLPVESRDEFRFIGDWRYNTRTGFAENGWSGERIRFRSWEEFCIEKRLLEKYLPEWELQNQSY